MLERDSPAATTPFPGGHGRGPASSIGASPFHFSCLVRLVAYQQLFKHIFTAAIQHQKIVNDRPFIILYLLLGLFFDKMPVPVAAGGGGPGGMRGPSTIDKCMRPLQALLAADSFVVRLLTCHSKNGRHDGWLYVSNSPLDIF